MGGNWGYKAGLQNEELSTWCARRRGQQTPMQTAKHQRCAQSVVDFCYFHCKQIACRPPASGVRRTQQQQRMRSRKPAHHAKDDRPGPHKKVFRWIVDGTFRGEVRRHAPLPRHAAHPCLRSQAGGCSDCCPASPSGGKYSSLESRARTAGGQVACHHLSEGRRGG